MGKVAGRVSTWSQNFLACLLAVVLTCAFSFPLQPRRAAADPLPSSSQEELIQELLQGDYVEGRVLVSVSDGAATNASSRSRSVSEGAALLSSGEDLMTVASEEEAPAPANGIAPLSLESDVSTETIKLIKSDTLTTEELIRALINEPGVTAVEPDYRWSREDTPATPLTLEEYSELTTTPAPKAASIGQPDLTSRQWAYQPNEEANIHVPGWDKDSSANMQQDVYVAVIDGGVDYTHPDLQGAFAKLPHVEVAGIESGDFGIDTWDYDEDPYETEDEHGTYCAGIIASTWNDGGISGVAARAKLVAVRIGNADFLSDTSAIQGFAYLKKLIEANVPVRVANCSWGSAQASNLLKRVVEELGRCGMVTVFASGNNGEDTGITRDTSTYVASPYTVTTGSSNERGQAEPTSSYSTRFVDVYAPGVNILSTACTSGYVGDNGKEVYRQDFEQYSPSADAVPVFMDGQGEDIESVEVSDRVFHSTDTSQATGHSIAIEAGKLAHYDNRINEGYFRMWVPRDKIIGAVGVGVQLAFVGNNPHVRTEVTVLDGRGAYSSFERDIWPVAPDHEHEIRWAEPTVTFPEITADPEVRKTIEVIVDIINVDGSALDGTLYVDDLVFGSGEALVPYAYKTGTSLAAPAISGATAVLMARDGYNGGTAQDAALAAATIAGSVVQEEAYKDLCVSSGTFDFDCLDNPVPVIRTLDLQGDQLNIGGYFFGTTKGAVTLTPEGGEPFEVTEHITSWLDRSIVVSGVDVPTGQVTVTVTAPRSSGNAFGRQTRLLNEDKDKLFGTDLTSTLPDDPEFDWQTGGTFTPLGGKLYYVFMGEYLGMGYAGSSVWAFDTVSSSWSKVPLPKALARQRCDGVQMTTYQGRLFLRTYVEGVWALHAYDPVTGEWQEYDLPEEISNGSTMEVLGDELLFIGGISYDSNSMPMALASIVAYDLETGQVSPRGSLSEARVFPDVRSDGTTMVVARGMSFDGEGNEVNLDTIEVIEVGDFDASTPSPASLVAGAPLAGIDVLDMGIARSGLVVIAGASGTDPDTITVPFDGTSLLKHPKRVSSVRMAYAACQAYEGKLYVLGFNDPTAPEGARVFRATEMETVHNPHTDLREPAKDPGKDPGKEPTADPTKDPTSTVDLPTTKPNPKPPVATGDSPALPAAVLLALAGFVGATVAARRCFKKERV